MLIYKCIMLTISLIFICLAVWGITKAILQYKREMRELDEKYNIKIICK